MTIKRHTLMQTLMLIGTLAYLAGCDGGAGTSSSAQATDSSQASSSSRSADSISVDAAPVAMRRLSKLEYNNTVRDLLGTALEPANDFPFDDFNQFDDAASFPSVSLPHLMWYNVSAARLAEEAIESALAGNRDVVNCDLEAVSCPQIVISEFGLRAWRRPITEAESERLMVFYDEALALSNNRAAAMQALLHRFILSPNFIFRPEFDEDINSSEAKELGSYELASRLSYFLWGSMPDEELFAKAADDSLKDSQVLRSQVARMIDSQQNTGQARPKK